MPHETRNCYSRIILQARSGSGSEFTIDRNGAAPTATRSAWGMDIGPLEFSHRITGDPERIEHGDPIRNFEGLPFDLDFDPSALFQTRGQDFGFVRASGNTGPTSGAVLLPSAGNVVQTKTAIFAAILELTGDPQLHRLSNYMARLMSLSCSPVISRSKLRLTAGLIFFEILEK